MVQIINRTNKQLPSFVEKVLQEMFHNYREVTVRSEFNSGLSGSRVFLVRPIRADGAELAAVVKVDHFSRIEQEWQAYSKAIKNKMPDAAQIDGEPTFLRGNPWGGLRYPLVGGGTFDIVSLQQFCQQANQEDILWMLQNRLLRSLGTLWQQFTLKHELHIHTCYESFLPGNLLIDYQPVPPGTPYQRLRPSDANYKTWKSGEYIEFEGFRVVKITPDGKQQLSLDTPEGSYVAFRFHVQQVPNISEYEVGQVLSEPMTGRIRQTRAEQLKDQVQQVLGMSVMVDGETVKLPGLELPNPLYTLPTVLNTTFDTVRFACIHGDLNLENILVDPQIGSAQLIDFARSGEDHVLKDLMQLETAVLLKLLPPTLDLTTLPQQIYTFYQQLHCFPKQNGSAPPGLEKQFAILAVLRKTAENYLFKRGDWSEYYAGLTIYLLGFLKFADLDKLPNAPAPKQVAFWAAATIQKLMAEKPDCQTLTTTGAHPVAKPEEKQPVEWPPKPVVSAEVVNRPVVYNSEVRLQLREALVRLFSAGELQDLCEFHLGFSYENLPGSSKPDKARELITYCERHGLSEELIRACRKSNRQFPL